MKKAVVIGAGMGGLTAANLLAKRGLEVTVLEQHYRPGGMMHRFWRRGDGKGVGYDTGFHYCGGVQAGQPLGQALRHLGVHDQLEFHALDPDGFDVIRFPGLDFRVPCGREAYADRLKETFPHERAGIDTAMAEMDRCIDVYGLYRLRPISDFSKLLDIESESVEEALRRHITDPKCRAVISGQAVLYGAPPWDAPWGVHSLILDHFLQGAYAIAGGGDRLALTMVKRIRELGGTVRLRTEATRIEVEGRQAKAVHTADGERIEADLVISNLHPRLTLGLLPDEATRKAYRSKVASQQVGHSHVGVYLQIDGRADCIGNRNIYRHYGWTEAYRETIPGDVGLYFANAPSEHAAQPDPDTGVILMLAPLDYQRVKPWKDSSHGNRPAAYEAFKHGLLDTMVGALVSDYPELEGRIVRAEASTSLSTEHFTRSPEGATYGHYHSVGQMGRYRPSQATRVRNLMLVGQGVFTPGVLGVTLSAYYALGHIFDLETLLKELRAA